MKILLITSVLPYPLRRNGGAQRTELMRSSLARFGEVDVLAIGGHELIEFPLTPEQIASKRLIGTLIRTPPGATAPAWAVGPLNGMVRLVRDRKRPYMIDLEASEIARRSSYDLIVSRYVSPAMQVGIDRQRGCAWILDFDDIDWQTLASQIADQNWGGISGKIGAQLAVRTVARAARRGLRSADAVWVTSSEDAMLVSRPTTILPNIPFNSASTSLSDPDNATLGFIGDMQFPPNVFGLEAFFAHAWPQVRAALPEAKLLLAGRGLSEALEAKWKAIAGVSVLGAIEDVETIYAQTVASIVPVFTGGGTKIKVLESLQMNRACIVASTSLRGYDALRQAGGVFEASSPADFARACIEAIRDRAKRVASVEAGRAVVEREFSRERFDAVVEQTIKRLLPSAAVV